MRFVRIAPVVVYELVLGVIRFGYIQKFLACYTHKQDQIRRKARDFEGVWVQEVFLICLYPHFHKFVGIESGNFFYIPKTYFMSSKK